MNVVFLRAANVGGRFFSPRKLADALGMVSLGAAGTFVAPARVTRAAILRRLPFDAEVMIRPAREILNLVQNPPFGRAAGRRFVSVLGKRSPTPPEVPIDAPAKGRWTVRVLKVAGAYAFSLWRRGDGPPLYPNAVIEKSLGVPATTRGWDTVVALAELLRR